MTKLLFWRSRKGPSLAAPGPFIVLVHGQKVPPLLAAPGPCVLIHGQKVLEAYRRQLAHHLLRHWAVPHHVRVVHTLLRPLLLGARLPKRDECLRVDGNGG